jgi:hypothetical protein
MGTQEQKDFLDKKKVIRVINKVGRQVYFRNLFRDLNILTLLCLYISEMVCWIKSNMGRMISNKEVHDYSTCQKLGLHRQFCRTNVAKNSGINKGIKLYNKLPPVIKNLEVLQEFKRKGFLNATHILLSGRVFIFLGAR